MPVVPSIERLTFRLTLVASPDGSTPRVRALTLVGYPGR